MTVKDGPADNVKKRKMTIITVIIAKWNISERKTGAVMNTITVNHDLARMEEIS